MSQIISLCLVHFSYFAKAVLYCTICFEILNVVET